MAFAIIMHVYLNFIVVVVVVLFLLICFLFVYLSVTTCAVIG